MSVKKDESNVSKKSQKVSKRSKKARNRKIVLMKKTAKRGISQRTETKKVDRMGRRENGQAVVRV